MSDGTMVEPYYVFEYPDWVSVLAIDKDDRAIVVREYRHGSCLMGLGLVGGGIDAKDASPEDAVRQEFEEETGYLSDDLINLGFGYANWANQNNRVHYFLARNCQSGGATAFDPTDHCELVLMDVSQLFEPGYFKQSFHLANILLAQKHLNGST